jgi:hypothetical protein
VVSQVPSTFSSVAVLGLILSDLERRIEHNEQAAAIVDIGLNRIDRRLKILPYLDLSRSAAIGRHFGLPRCREGPSGLIWYRA